MKAPDGFVFDSKAHPFKITPSMNVVDLMDEMEQVYEEASNETLELQINVLWNTKDPKKALNPTEKVQMHFADGETFGVYGEIAPAQTARMEKPEEEKIPVTILTGFLGAGKTTMLNYILQEQREKKIAIIENEFGEVPIDDALLKQEKLALAEKIVVMDNGCMCCTIRGDLLSGPASMNMDWQLPSLWPSTWFQCCTQDSSDSSRVAPARLGLPFGKCRGLDEEDEFFDCAETDADLCRLRSADPSAAGVVGDVGVSEKYGDVVDDDDDHDGDAGDAGDADDADGDADGDTDDAAAADDDDDGDAGDGGLTVVLVVMLVLLQLMALILLMVMIMLVPNRITTRTLLMRILVMTTVILVMITGMLWMLMMIDGDDDQDDCNNVDDCGDGDGDGHGDDDQDDDGARLVVTISAHLVSVIMRFRAGKNP
eukprot:s2824_g5.t1